MGTHLRWLASSRTSALHTAAALARGWPLADRQLASGLAVPAEQLSRALAETGAATQRVWERLLAWSAQVDTPRQLSEVALQKAGSSAARDKKAVSALAARLAAVEKSIQQIYPQLTEDLDLRSGPIRHQWLEHGPGLLLRLGQVTEPALIPEQADVILVLPALGGGGAAHLLTNSLRIEAVLYNPEPRLPESLRLAWLLAQLQQDVPRFGESVPADRLPLLAALAVIPATLRAAETVELAELNEPLLDTALSTWLGRSLPDADWTPILADWWETYEATRPPWHVALGALERMIPWPTGDT